MARGIQAEIKQNKPFDSLEAEAFLSLLRTADQLQGLVAEMLKPHGISPTQYNALRILRGAGAQGLACREIGERMIHRDPDITRLVNRLEGRGLVTRSRGRVDRRVMKTRITAAGLAMLRGLDRPVAEFQRRLLGGLGAARLRGLIRLLEAVREIPSRRQVFLGGSLAAAAKAGAEKNGYRSAEALRHPKAPPKGATQGRHLRRARAEFFSRLPGKNSVGQ